MIAELTYDKPFPSAIIRVPPVRLRSGQVYFQPEGPMRSAKGQSERLVFDFANLAEAPEQAFIRFAEVWGVLGLCPHDNSMRSPRACPAQPENRT